MTTQMQPATGPLPPDPIPGRRPRRLAAGAAVLLGLALAGGAAPAGAASFTYGDFGSTAGLTLNGAAAQSGTALRLVPSLDSQAGSAFRTAPVALGGSFSTSFSFRVTSDANSALGVTDGFTFLLQRGGASALGAGGQGLGYVGLDPSVAVVFRGRDPSFIGVVQGGTDPANLAGDPKNPGSANFAPPGSASGLTEALFYDRTQYAWIDYGLGNLLSVYLSDTAAKPASAIATATLNIDALLGNQVYVGFSAGNGGAFGTQDILDWTFGSAGTAAVPEPATLALLGAGLLGLATLRRRGRPTAV
ncbi:L-type lectin-domain containing protein [Paracraurococcus ruber]|uniref:Legume lectin domain-containing protein n=1 Tax=Paracraurococcus ruber TaxID=77675 RepID=A0ABS1D5V4_9PROT|nr:L-type lectin-domain containing protein [Paracraurococcus ruber]MBK1661855.1 hypothetical protein [Paracraurococcus ruber]TDG17228.1 PEP-CTERM sorting domain-containing protein [Paracraurococcus ruber]